MQDSVTKAARALAGVKAKRGGAFAGESSCSEGEQRRWITRQGQREVAPAIGPPAEVREEEREATQSRE